MNSELRPAFFTDSFHEINGVAHTSRQLERYAREEGLPLLSVHAGTETHQKRDEACLSLELKRSRMKIPLDEDLAFDPFIFRHWSRVVEASREFQPNVIHITGPGDMGLLGVLLAWRHRIPLVSSWHTNLHEYAARRWPLPFGKKSVEDLTWQMLMWFYRFSSISMAPNEELRSLLEDSTHRPVYLMERGIDTELFHPARRKRNDQELVLGYVGRLRPEKNVQLLVEVERALISAGIHDYRFLIVGEGSQRAWLQENMQKAHVPGVQRGVELAESYASMDLFLFPSWTDTYGNVIAESLASGVPAVVTSGGGPRFLVQHGESGLVAESNDDFVRQTVNLARNRERIVAMQQPSRDWTMERSWENVFRNVWNYYDQARGGSWTAASRTNWKSLAGKIQHLPR